MKDTVQSAYHDILAQQRLDEGLLKNTVAAIGAVASIATAGLDANAAPKKPEHVKQFVAAIKQKLIDRPIKANPKALVDIITTHYDVDKGKAKQFVTTAMKYAKPDFPQAHHILSVVGVESGFKDNQISGLKHDPAIGAMQIRPGVWNLSPRELNTIDGALKHGANILSQYYQQTGSKEAAIRAYNIGIGNASKKDPKHQSAGNRYLDKFNDHLSKFFSDKKA